MNKLALFIFVLFPFFGFSQKDTVAHYYTFGSVANEEGEDVSATDDGGFAVIGSTASSGGGNSDIYFLKVDSLCNYQWSWALGGTNNDWGYAIKQTFDKGFIIAASTNSYGNGGYDAMLLKRDSLGNFQWQKTFGGNDWDFAYDVVQTFDSGFVFCGETYNNTNGFSDVYVVKTNSLGDTLWTRTIGGNLIDKGNALIETSDSSIVVAGIKNTITDSTQAYVLKFDKDGTLLWDSLFGGVKYENIFDVIELQSGKYAFTGSSNSQNSNLDVYFIKLDTNGVLLSTNTIVTSGVNSNDDESKSLIQLQDGRLLLIGYTKTYGYAKKDVIINAVDENGNWAGIGVTLGYLENDEINSAIITTDGRIVLVGKTNSYGIGNNDLFLIRLDTIYQTNYFYQHIYLQYEDIAPISVNELYNINSGLIVYPNPVKSVLNIKTKNYPIFLNVYDNIGRKVFSSKIQQENTAFNISFLQKGLYTLVFSNSLSIYETKKLVVTE